MFKIAEPFVLKGFHVEDFKMSVLNMTLMLLGKVWEQILVVTVILFWLFINGLLWFIVNAVKNLQVHLSLKEAPFFLNAYVCHN